MEKDKYKDQEEVFSNMLRAGNRSYFFDVKKTKKEDFYITITESKKKFKDNGRHFYEKHKLFLYKEDFENFMEGLNQAIVFAQESNYKTAEMLADYDNDEINENVEEKEFINIDFEDLKD